MTRVRDGRLKGALKQALAKAYRADVEKRRARAGTPWVLKGECGGCASCCEAPSIAVGAFVYFVPVVRHLFLWWQRVVNGFELVGTERAARAFVFRCTHFDVVSRRCDSYDTRPGMCRDYPRLLLEQAHPEFFARCGYSAVAKNGEELLASLQAAGVDGDQLVQITRKLRLR
jgi:Fe-S-cluster containining protein